MKTTPEFTDAEIQNMMDFKQVITLTEDARRRNKVIVRRVVTTVLVTGLISTAFLMYNRYSSSESSTTSQQPISNQPASNNPPAEVLSDSALRSTPPVRTEASKTKPVQQPVTAKAKEPAVEENKTETTTAIQVDSAKAVPVFLPAEPVDGYTALYDYFGRELRYPEEAIKDSIQGIITVTFIINKQGAPEQVATDHMLGEAFQKEAIRLIEHMPAWKPAQLNGSPVKSKLSVPITFTVKTTRQQ